MDDLELEHGPQDLQHQIVVASTREQMQKAQTQLISWVDRKLEHVRGELAQAEVAYKSAIASKWRSSGFKTQVNKHLRQIAFYDKVKVALEAGYTIIPNFNTIDIFAIRTCKEEPESNDTSNQYSLAVPDDQISESPMLGEGRYVNATAEVVRWTENAVDKNGNKTEVSKAYANQHAEVDFPFKLVRPEILDSTRAAMEHLCFDDIGILPARQRVRRHQDPMVIGRIHNLGRPGRTVSFLITWWVDTRSL